MRKSPTKLTKAPLLEVVFEVRWKLHGPSETPLPFRQDPGYAALSQRFRVAAERHGLPFERRMVGPTDLVVGYSVEKRYFKSAKDAFPIWQIGPGIFAANFTYDYDWKTFRRFALNGFASLLRHYPDLADFPLTFTHLELRYVDIFDEKVGGTNFFNFVHSALDMAISEPKVMSDRKLFGAPAGGRVVLFREVAGMKGARFIYDLASVEREGKRATRMESKIVSTGDGFKLPKPRARLPTAIGKWLDQAHGVTSPFFKRVVKAHILRTFQ